METQPAPPTGIEILRSAAFILDSYIRGEERGKEQEDYDKIVNSLRQTHPGKAAILEKGFAELRTVKNDALKATAKKIRNQLGEID